MFSKFRFVFVSALVVLGLLAAVAPESVAARSAPYMAWPTTGRITQPFGCTGFRAEPAYHGCPHFHGGIDIANVRGTHIYAAAAGTVSYIGLEPWYHGPDRAWVVVIKHGNGVVSIYVHLLKKSVPGIHVGTKVSQGDLIGYMGMTGRATGYHLHFGVKVDGVWTNPEKFMATVAPAAH